MEITTINNDIYITSNKIAEVGDFVIDSITNKVFKVIPNECLCNPKKIMYSTNPSLNL